MELRDFAERVLFGTTLEEKLQPPEHITDDHPGSAIIAPVVPGRPTGLQFKPQGSGKGEFPGVHQLEQERERGRLLHFFANHELLATELMALVLLRFPDAPAAFRRGVLQTLKDEQEHTRMYLARMKQCGIQFGELPVSGYFWRSVSTMENPIDYVAGLSLTFEQANLDFAREFSRGFAAVGDTATARLLEKIYRDEIAHVAYGLKWFRRWKNPQESDWEAFCRQLKFPLTPQRAKGFKLNVEGRNAAGFDPEFIARLDIFSHSKGRTPSVFVFNPFAEGYIARAKTFAPVKHQAHLQRDLENLPQFLCRQDDIVLVNRRPAIGFLSGIKQAGFALPEFVELRASGERAGRCAVSSIIGDRKLGTLRPWAWGPDSVELLEPLFPNVTGENRKPEQRFNDQIARLYAKTWSADFLRQVLSTSDGPRDLCLCSEDQIGVAVGTLEEALAAIAAIRSRNHHRIVLKEAHGLAGSNAIRLWEPELLESQRQWIATATRDGRQIVVEPWLERVIDFSIQLEMTGQGLKLCGYTGLINDQRGQFRGNWVSPGFNRRIPPEVVRFLIGEANNRAGLSHRLEQFYAAIFARLELELKRIDYVGPLGIDAFVYRAEDGTCRLKPIVEINPRYTMGRLTLELMRQTAPGSYGLFSLINGSMLKAEGFENFSTYAAALMAKHPVQMEGEPVSRIREGAVCLNDPAEAKVCLAIFRVSRAVPPEVP